MAGVDLKTVQELMGHKAFDMTVRYAHIALTHMLQAAGDPDVPGFGFGADRPQNFCWSRNGAEQKSE